jgi:hypothetical protein
MSNSKQVMGQAFKIHTRRIVGTMATKRYPNYPRLPLQDKWLQKGYILEEVHTFLLLFYWTPLPPLSHQLARQATQREEILAVIAGGGGGGKTNKTTAIRLANIFPFLSQDKTKTFAS